MRRKLIYVFVIIFVTFLIFVVIRFFENTLTANQYNKIALLVTVLVGVISLLGSIPGVQEFFGSLIKEAPKDSDLSQTQQQHNRLIMLQKVKVDWIDGFLKSSLRGATFIQLRMKYMPDMVEDLWGNVLSRQRNKTKNLPIRKDISSIYEEFGGSLLILGEGGSGKTTTLLELTKELIKEAESDSSRRIPVVFNLSTWGINRGEMDVWLINEMQLRYQIPAEISRGWIKRDELILMLDGLDEVDKEFRDECVQKINNFKSQHMVRLAITCRLPDYKLLTNKLKVSGAICQMPLTTQQIDKYLANLGNIRKIIQKDPVLLSFAESPLWLSVMAVAYQSVNPDSLKSESQEERRTQLFETYIQSMFEHRRVGKLFTAAQIVDGLVWLAHKMLCHAQTIFRIEQLQPVDIENKIGRKLYSLILSLNLWILVSFPFGMACGISIYFITSSNVQGLIGGFLFGITGGLAIWIIETGFYSLSYRVAIGVVTGMSMGYLIWILNQNLPLSILIMVILSVSIAYVFGRIGNMGSYLGSSNILTSINIRNLDWDFKKAVYGFFKRLPIGVFIGLGGGIATIGLFGLAKGFLIGVGFMFATALVGGLAYGNIDSKIGAVYMPNEGTWRSFRNALKLGLGSGIVLGIVLGAMVAMLTNLRDGLISGMLFFFAAFIIDGLVSGGMQALQHAVLRMVLRFESRIPLNYPKFLNQTVYHIFMFNVGNGYIFIHRLLLEHFASKRSVHD